MDSLGNGHQSEQNLMGNIYETFECHLGTVGLWTSKRCEGETRGLTVS
jgi:hypothetical protein